MNLLEDTLGATQETNFRRWYGSLADVLGHRPGHVADNGDFINGGQGFNPNPDDPRQFYDYRKAFQSGLSGPNWESAEIYGRPHWDSRFKLEGHPRMVIDGINTKTGQRVQ